MKLQSNMITKQTELINGDTEFREKLSITDSEFDKLKKRLKFLTAKSQLSKCREMCTDCNNVLVANAQKLQVFQVLLQRLTQRTCPADF